MLTVNEIQVNYDGITAVHEATFEVKEGELISIVGANGAGKTTILKAIIGSLHPVAGEIKFLSKNITHMPTMETVKQGIIYVPEDKRIFGPLSVEENLRLGAYTVREERKIQENLNYIYELFPRLKERSDQPGGTLSGGEQGILSIGRGLMANPRLLMLDEPTLGLMPKLVTTILERIGRLNEEGMTVLLVEQNVQEALDLASRGYALQTGNIVKEGKGEELLASDLIKKAFLGL